MNSSHGPRNFCLAAISFLFLTAAFLAGQWTATPPHSQKPNNSSNDTVHLISIQEQVRCLPEPRPENVSVSFGRADNETIRITLQGLFNLPGGVDTPNFKVDTIHGPHSLYTLITTQLPSRAYTLKPHVSATNGTTSTCVATFTTNTTIHGTWYATYTATLHMPITNAQDTITIYHDGRPITTTNLTSLTWPPPQ